MLALEEARARILRTLRPLPTETVPLCQAGGRIATEAVVAPLNLPGFDNSAVDGYAVRSADLQSAQGGQTVSLRLTASLAAGQAGAPKIAAGTCIRVFTGSALPNGADAVIMQEDIRKPPDRTGEIICLTAVAEGENVRRQGEDVSKGDSLVAPGERISAGALSLLAALGLGEAKVGASPRVALLATGTELVEPGNPLPEGKIYESNRAGLAALLTGAGAIPRRFPVILDELAATRSALRTAFAECDAVITTGGVSVGEFDWVKQAFEEVGGELDFWKVAIRPGKPFVFGQWLGKPLFGLPGNPVSAFVTFLLLVRPAILRMQGAAAIELPTHPGILCESMSNSGDRRHFARVVVDEKGGVRSAGKQASHAMASLARANGLVDLAPGVALEPGSSVVVIRF